MTADGSGFQRKLYPNPLLRMKTDKLGRTRQPTSGAAGPKHLPGTGGARAGDDFDASPPAHFDLHAAEWWTWAVDQLTKMGVIDSADRKIIELGAETYSEYRLAQEDCAKLGRILAREIPDGGTRYTRNPAFVTLESARSSLRSLYSDLGLTPSARQKFAGNGGDDADPFADLMAN